MTRWGHRAATALALLSLLTTACGGSDDEAASAGSTVTVTDAWARATPPGTSTGAVYLTASSEAADALVGADVDDDVAASAALHMTMSGSDGTTTMHEVASIDVPAGGSLVLEPASYHLMLTDLAGPLEPGGTFELTLHFEAAGDTTVTIEVRDEAP